MTAVGLCVRVLGQALYVSVALIWPDKRIERVASHGAIGSFIAREPPKTDEAVA